MIVTKETVTTTVEKITVRVNDSGCFSVENRKEIEIAKAIIDAISESNLNSESDT